MIKQVKKPDSKRAKNKRKEINKDLGMYAQDCPKYDR